MPTRVGWLPYVLIQWAVEVSVGDIKPQKSDLFPITLSNLVLDSIVRALNTSGFYTISHANNITIRTGRALQFQYRYFKSISNIGVKNVASTSTVWWLIIFAFMNPFNYDLYVTESWNFYLPIILRNLYYSYSGEVMN